MQFLRDRFWAFAILAAIAASFVIGNAESSTRDRAQRAQLVRGCERTSARTAVLVAAEFDIADARLARGEPHGAEDAEAYANGLLTTIPLPASESPGGRAIVVVHKVSNAGGPPAYLPTALALSLQRAGCERAYP